MDRVTRSKQGHARNRSLDGCEAALAQFDFGIAFDLVPFVGKYTALFDGREGLEIGGKGVGDGDRCWC